MLCLLNPTESDGPALLDSHDEDIRESPPPPPPRTGLLGPCLAL